MASSKKIVKKKTAKKKVKKSRPSKKPVRVKTRSKKTVLKGRAKTIYNQFLELSKKRWVAPKKKRSISKKAASIYRLLQKEARKKIPKKDTGFSKNNFNYIRSLLWRHYKADFKGYKDGAFLKVVNELYNDCKPLGDGCTDEVILERYARLKKEGRRPKPFIDPELFNPQAYFEIKDVEFIAFAPYLWIVSPMIIPAPHEFIVTDYYYHYTKKLNAPNEDLLKFIAEINSRTALANLSKKQDEEIRALAKKPLPEWGQADRIRFIELFAKYNEDITRGYDTYFKEWVNWCNDAMRAEYGGKPPSDKIFFRFQEPEYNEVLDRWESVIVICTSSGQIFDFGFKPTGKLAEHEVQQEFVPAKAAQLKPATTAEEEKQQEELKKQRNVASLQNILDELRDKLRKQQKKDKENDIRLFLLEQQKKEKELSRLKKILNELRKNLKEVRRQKDKEEEQKLYNEMKRINQLIIDLSK